VQRLVVRAIQALFGVTVHGLSVLGNHDFGAKVIKKKGTAKRFPQ
jgi:hypothetical protein